MCKIKGDNNSIKATSSNKGITLIALVITIIVLLILAGISISMLTGENGIITQANYAAFATKIGEYKDKVTVHVAGEQLNSGEDVGNTNVNVLDPEEMKGILGEDREPGDENKYVIQDNELRYNPDTVTDQEEKWLIRLGILAMTVSTFLITFMASGSVYQTIQSNKITFPTEEPMTNTQEFAGWFYDQEYTNQAIEGDELTGDITLYAKMNDLELHTITFYDWDHSTVIDTIESGRVVATDNTPQDKLPWTCGCGSYNPKYEFIGYDYYYEYHNPTYLEEGQIIDRDAEAMARYRFTLGGIQEEIDGTYEYNHYVMIHNGEIVEERKDEVKQKVEILNGMYKGEKIKSVEIEDVHLAVDVSEFNGIGSNNYFDKPVEYVVEHNPILITIDNEGNLKLLREPELTEYIDDSGVIGQSGKGGYRYVHFITNITTESGKTEKVLFNIWYNVFNTIYCLAEGTKITLADMSNKNIEDITYEDELLVWDFDNGCFAKAKPLWIKKVQEAEEYNLIKFDDGTELKTVIDHRIFNIEKQKFTYTMDEEETPIGTSVFKEDGSVAKIVERSVVKEKVNYYNVITDYHMNLFANGLLTSLRLNNLYKIENMKFVKDDRELTPREEFEGIPDKYFYGLRLAEQPKEINRGNDVRHTKTLQEYVERLLPLEK